MPRIRLERGPVVCEHGALAVTAWTRTKGLLGRSSLDPDEGLWIQPTGSIHMWFMRFPIDVVYLDSELRVTKVVHGLAPWRFSAGRRARSVVELAAGTSARAGLTAGARLSLVEPTR